MRLRRSQTLLTKTMIQCESHCNTTRFAAIQTDHIIGGNGTIQVNELSVLPLYCGQ
jgi:hypothetical protein